MVKILIFDDDDFHKGLFFIPKSPFPDWLYIYTHTYTNIHIYNIKIHINEYMESQIPLGSEYFWMLIYMNIDLYYD